MCRVFMMAGITKDTNAKAVKLLKAIAEPMSRSNTDGIGYAAVKSDGSLFGQRWWINSHAFKNPPAKIVREDYEELLAEHGKAIDIENFTPINPEMFQNSFGEVDLTQLSAVTLHTRMATSAKSFANTHPFHDPEADTSLIHNGVIRNDNEFDLKLSTCDSEAILIAYLKANVADDTRNIQAMANQLKGYYACGVFGRDAQGRRVMDIFKSDASLHGAFIKELGVPVYSTHMGDIEEACRKVGLTVGPRFKYNSCWMIRIDYLTGRVLRTESFKESQSQWDYNRNAYGEEYDMSKYHGPMNAWGGEDNETAAGRHRQSGESCNLPALPEHNKGGKGKKKTAHVNFTGKQKNISPAMMEYLRLHPTTRALRGTELIELNQEVKASEG